MFNDTGSGDLGTSDEDDFASANYEQCYSLRVPSPEGKHTKDQLENIHTKVLTDCSSRVGLTSNSKGDGEPSSRVKSNNNIVAIFRDREKDRKDLEFDRSYDR